MSTMYVIHEYEINRFLLCYAKIGLCGDFVLLYNINVHILNISNNELLINPKLCQRRTKLLEYQSNNNNICIRTGKIGGADKLTPTQSNSLERQQIAEFKKRYKPKITVGSGSNRLPGNYAGRSSDNRAELVLCVDGKGDIYGCAGVEGELFILLREKEDELYMSDYFQYIIDCQMILLTDTWTCAYHISIFCS